MNLTPCQKIINKGEYAGFKWSMQNHYCCCTFQCVRHGLLGYYFGSGLDKAGESYELRFCSPSVSFLMNPKEIVLQEVTNSHNLWAVSHEELNKLINS